MNRTNAGRTTGKQVVRFAFVGGLCTVLYLALYVCLRLVLGPQVSNVVALLISAVANTVLNRRITFELPGRPDTREHASGLFAFLIGAGLSALSLWLLHSEDPHPSRLVEVGALLAATAVATVVRFVLFQRWVFGPALDAQSGR